MRAVTPEEWGRLLGLVAVLRSQWSTLNNRPRLMFHIALQELFDHARHIEDVLDGKVDDSEEVSK